MKKQFSNNGKNLRNRLVTQAVLQRALKPVYKKLDDYDKRFDDLAGRLDGLGKKVRLSDYLNEQRFTAIERKLSEMDKKMDTMFVYCLCT